MITNIPKPSKYKISGVECLIQAYDNIFKIDNELTPDTPRDRIWEYNQIVLRTSFSTNSPGRRRLNESEDL